jgi:hypothetical protein
MAKSIRVRKEMHGNRIVLVAADPYSEELMFSLGMGKDYNLSLTGARKRGNLNLYWAGLATLVDNLGGRDKQRWPTSRHLHDTMLLALGFTHRLYRLDPKSIDGVGWIDIPDSIAIDNMDEDEFAQLFETIRGAVVKRWGWDPWDSWKDEKDAAKANAKRLAAERVPRGRAPPRSF